MPISTSGLSVPQLSGNGNIDTSIYGNINKPQQTSIADMLGLAKSGYELSKMKELYPAMIEKEQALSKTAQIDASKAQFGFTKEQGEAAQNEAGRLLTDPRIKNAKNTPEGRDGALRALDEVADTLKTKGLHDDVIKGMLGQYYTQAIHDPTQISPKITQGLLAASGAQNQIDINYPSATSVGGVPGFQNRLQQSFSPITTPTQAPQTQLNAPSQNVGGTNQQQVSPQKIVQETFPNRANTPYVSDTEKPRFEEGTKILSDARLLGESAKTQLNDIQNVRKYIKATTGTALGQGARTAAKLIAENPDFDSLIKSTAQLQLNAAGQLNSNTDAARALLAATTGDGGNISEKALARLLDTAEADLTAASKYSTGIQNFAKKRGNTGGILNAPDFKQAWTENAKDRRIYQLININANPELSNAQKTMMRDELLKNENPATVKALLQQMKAMKQLEKGD